VDVFKKTGKKAVKVSTPLRIHIPDFKRSIHDPFNGENMYSLFVI
jgi:hypothetical protein